MTQTSTTTTTYTYPRADFTIVGAHYVAYENSAKSGASGIAMFSPIAIANDRADDDAYRLAADADSKRRAMIKFRAMLKRGAAERLCVFVASGDNDRQRFTTADADALARFVSLNDVRKVEGTDLRWFALAAAGMVADAVSVAPKAGNVDKPWEGTATVGEPQAATQAAMVADEDDVDAEDDAPTDDEISAAADLTYCAGCDTYGDLFQCGGDATLRDDDLLERAFPC